MPEQVVPENVLSEMWQFLLKTSAVSELLKEKTQLEAELEKEGQAQ